MRTRVTLPTPYICFPQRCVHCGGEPEIATTIRATRGIDLVIISWGNEVSLDIPTCRRCRRRRRIAGLLSIPAFVIVFMLLLIAVPRLEQSVFVSRAMILVLVVGLIVVFPRFVGNRRSGWLDAWLLGVRAVKLTKSPPTVTLVFRDRLYAHEAETLTQDYRSAALREADAYLAERGPAAADPAA